MNRVIVIRSKVSYYIGPHWVEPKSSEGGPVQLGRSR
jgi:hypothetical protein